jgi:phosphomannomutase / phosphoglucomutase
MLSAPRSELRPNTPDYERLALVNPTGFREYDARWLFGPEINLLGIQALGLGLRTYLHERGAPPDIVTGHDFRSYSGVVKQALIVGLMASGCRVHDIDLALSPTAYFAQSELGIAAEAEGPVSEETMQSVLKAIELELARHPEVGPLAWH